VQIYFLCNRFEKFGFCDLKEFWRKKCDQHETKRSFFKFKSKKIVLAKIILLK